MQDANGIERLPGDAVLIRAIALVATVSLLTSAPIGAQSASKVSRIGVLWQTSPPPPIHPHISALLKNPRLEWYEGKLLLSSTDTPVTTRPAWGTRQ